MARPKYSEAASTTKTYCFIALGGDVTPLTEIRKEARTNHMSPTTLCTSLKTLEYMGLTTRIYDMETRPPRVGYRRTTPLPKGSVDFDSWFQTKMELIRTSTRTALEKIRECPRMPSDDLDKIRQDMRGLIDTVCDSMVQDFRDLLRSHKIVMQTKERGTDIHIADISKLGPFSE